MSEAKTVTIRDLIAALVWQSCSRVEGSGRSSYYVCKYCGYTWYCDESAEHHDACFVALAELYLEQNPEPQEGKEEEN